MIKKQIEKKKILIFFLIGIFLFSLNLVFAITQPTQQFSKIFLNPFYTASLTKNINYTFVLSLSIPDGISRTISSLVTFQIYATSSPQDFFLKVNGKDCNNPSFSATSSGLTFATYDCSNVINDNTNYTLTLFSTKDGGSAIGWLDLTYINNPKGEMTLSGTEYYPNDNAIIFLQLKDSQGIAIESGSCYLNVYTPLINGTHSLFIDNAPMLHIANGTDGIYYYDLITPSNLGVYMISAKCFYALNKVVIYDKEDLYNYPIRMAQIGTWSGTEVSLNSYEDDSYESCAHSGNICSANYSFNISIYGKIDNFTNIDLWWNGHADKTGMTLAFNYWNGTDYNALPNSKSLDLINGFQSNSIPSNAIDPQNNEVIYLKLNSTGGSHKLYNNWLSLTLFSSTENIQEVKGSGEMHIREAPSKIEEIWNWSGTISSSILNYFSNAIWNFESRNLTYTEDVTNYSQVAEYVWKYGEKNLSYYEVNNISVDDIWNYMSRNLTFTEDMTNYSQIAEYVWFYIDRNLTTEIIANLSLEEIWGYYNRSLTDDIPMQVWGYEERNLTTDIPFEVWSYYNRTLTYYTLNLTEIIEMINEYDFTDIPILLPEFKGEQVVSYTLNVTLIVPV